jgi:biotin transport system substrate-specific component
MNTEARTATLAGIVWPETSGTRALRFVILTVLGTMLLTLSAKVTVPFWPVQMSLQTFAVLALSAALGWRIATATVLLYLVEGALGAPVFQGTPERGIGIAYMMGPTGGYLLGFLAQALIVGHAAETWARGSILKLGAAMLVSEIVMFALGLAWLGTVIGWDKPVLAFGLYPFVPGDLVKLALAAITVPSLTRMAGRWRG